MANEPEMQHDGPHMSRPDPDRVGILKLHHVDQTMRDSPSLAVLLH
jgi:hypothetical protein